jgi:hypothetical protein
LETARKRPRLGRAAARGYARQSFSLYFGLSCQKRARQNAAPVDSSKKEK